MQSLVWSEHPGNPLIHPPKWDFIIADPSFLPPDQTPDGRWHLFAHGVVRGILHYVSDDGIRYDPIGVVVRGLRPFILRHEGVYYLYFESIRSPFRSEIRMIHSTDLSQWSAPVTVLAPSLPWEGGLARTNSNPCVVVHEGRFLLYYSAALCWLSDCGFPEPKFIGLAEGDSPFGPFVKREEPMISPSQEVAHRNHGAGAIKVVRDEFGGLFWGFTNGIYIDQAGHSRSDIRLLKSTDGWRFEEALDSPLVGPEGDGWKRALVYALDVRKVGEEWWMYFNARDGWFRGKERIGLTVGRGTKK